METEYMKNGTTDESRQFPERAQPLHPVQYGAIPDWVGQLERAEAAREAAELANREKDQVLAAICHDLRAPLNAILGWAQVARRMPDSLASAKALSRIEANVCTQALLINDILDLTRSEHGVLRIESEPVDLNTAIEEALMVVEPTAADKGVQIQCSLSALPAVILGDRRKIHRIVWNLLTNAIKFTPSGGTVTVTVKRDNALCQIKVSDTGCGINPKFLPRIFEKFEQDFSSSDERAFTGAGLGLAIARRIAEMHGGKIEAESPGKDRGAAFTVSFPATDLTRKQTEERLHTLI